MSNGYRLVLVSLTLLALAAQAPAHWDRTSLLINVPTAEVLPMGSLAISANMSTRNWFNTSMQYDGLEAGAAVRFAPIDRLEVALTAYTLKDYVLGASYRLLGGPGGAGMVIGIHDMGLSSYVSPVGSGLDDAWEDWKYEVACPPYSRPMENFSAFAVGTIPVASFAKLHVGIGRGRYVGYSRGLNINTDALFSDKQTRQWAVGLLGGAEINFGKHVSLGAEFDGRDVNAGFKLIFGPITGAIAMTKLEGLTGREGYEFGRFDAAISYQIDNLIRRPVKTVPLPEPEPEPEPIIEKPVSFELLPIYFGLDSSNIRPIEEEILRRNAEAILARGKAGLKADVVIEGHCCPLASDDYNVGLGMRRAEAARKYLVGLGIDPALLTTETYGELNPPYLNEMQYHLDRRAEFRWREQ